MCDICDKKEKTPYILFDFDGTLADSMGLALAIANIIAKDINESPIAKEDIQYFKENGAFKFLKYKKISLFKAAILLKKSSEIFAESADKVHLFPEIIESLKSLKDKDVKMGIVTSNKEKVVRKILANAEVEDLFDFIHSELAIFKKDVALRAVICENNIDVENSLYIGDEVRDVNAAKIIGLKFIGVSWGFNDGDSLVSAGAIKTLKTPAEIATLCHPRISF